MQISPERYRRVAVASLLALIAVTVAGAAVRLTNSGLGCDDWPNCNDTSFVDVSSKHAAIEQVNRLFNGIVTIAVLFVSHALLKQLAPSILAILTGNRARSPHDMPQGASPSAGSSSPFASQKR